MTELQYLFGNGKLVSVKIILCLKSSFSCCFNKLNGQLNLDSKLCWFGITM
jgi:hypothetical protein